MCSKWANSTFLGTPNAYFWFQYIFKAFWDFWRAKKRGPHKLKTRQKHLFWHPTWSRIIFGKKFCTQWNLLT